MSREEFTELFRDLCDQPLLGRPKDDDEMGRFLRNYYSKLSKFDADGLQRAIREFGEAPACEHCGRHSGRLPLPGELVMLIRRHLARTHESYKPWPKGLDPASQIANAQDDGYRPHCSACNDTGWRPVETKDGTSGVVRCDCQGAPA